MLDNTILNLRGICICIRALLDYLFSLFSFRAKTVIFNEVAFFKKKKSRLDPYCFQSLKNSYDTSGR